MVRLLVVWVSVWVCLRSQQVRGEILPGVGSFYFHPIPMNWSSAADYCRSTRNETLAYPYTKDEADLLISLMQTYHAEYILVGFHDKFHEGMYYTVEGDRVSAVCYNVWYRQNGDVQHNCGAFKGTTSNAGLFDISCSETRNPFVCVNRNFFKEDYDFVPGYGYYKHHRSRRTWYDAQATCEGEGARMLVLNSEGELEALRNLLGQFTVWVGVHHVHVNQQFLTIYDEPLSYSGFSRWTTGEPNGNNEEKPYVICSSAPGLGLALSGASELNQFICEYPLGATAHPTNK